MFGCDICASNGEAAGTLSPGSLFVGRGLGEEVVERPEGHGEGLQAFMFGGAEVGEEVLGVVVGVGVAESNVDSGGKLGTGPDPLVAVKGGVIVAEASVEDFQDISEVGEEEVVIGVRAEVNAGEGVGSGEGRGLLSDILLEQGGENLGVETQQVSVKFVDRHGEVRLKPGEG